VLYLKVNFQGMGVRL